MTVWVVARKDLEAWLVLVDDVDWEVFCEDKERKFNFELLDFVIVMKEYDMRNFEKVRR